MTFAKALIIGRLGDDPKIHNGNNDSKFATARLAVNRGTGENQTTLWFDVSVDGDNRAASFAKAKKGSSVFVEGMFTLKENEGKPAYLRVAADNFRVMTKTEESESVIPFAKLILVGRLGAQPEVIKGNEGNFASGRLAVNRGSGEDQVTTWFDVTVDGDRRVEVFSDAPTGSTVYVDGYMATRVNEGRTYVRVSADTFRVLSSTGQSAA